MTQEDRENLFCSKLTDQPKKFSDVVKETGIDFQEAKSIAEKLQGQNKITITNWDSGYGNETSFIHLKLPKRLLTPQDKDRLLDSLLENLDLERSYSLNMKVLCESTKLSFENIEGLLPQFQKRGLIDYGGITAQTNISLLLHQEASDFKRDGGFTFQETIINTQISKLFAELHDLEKSHSWEKFGNIMGIVANITEVISKLKG